MRMDRGYISPYFITNPKTQKCEFDNPYVLLVEKKVSNMQQLIMILEQVAREGKALVIGAFSLFIHEQAVC